MDLNLDDLESTPTAKKSGRGGLLVLLIGIAIGVAGTLFLPRYVTPLLPESLRGGGEQVDGVVLAMGRDGDKLLITVDTQKGAVLATFTQRVAEVELLVRVGDTLTLGMDRYDPFVSDPAIAAVRKDRSLGGLESGAPAATEGATDSTQMDGDGAPPTGELDFGTGDSAAAGAAPGADGSAEAGAIELQADTAGVTSQMAEEADAAAD